MKYLPKTLFGRILLAMFCGLLAVQSVGVWLMLEDRGRFGERLLGEYVAQRIAGILVILDEAPPAERVRLVRDRKSTRLNSSHVLRSRMPSSA